MRAYKVIIIILALVASLLSVSSMTLAGPTYDVTYVDDDGPNIDNHFTDLNAALAATAADGTIYIAAGTYTLISQLYVSDDIAFIGEGADKVFIDADGGPYAFYVRNASVYIYGCSITGAGTGVYINWEYSGEYAAYLHKNAIYGVSDADSGVHVYMYDGVYGELDIIDNEIYENKGDGIFVQADYDSELLCNIEDNTIYDNDASGIYFSAYNSIIETNVLNNEIYGNGALTNNTGINYYIDTPEVGYIAIEGNSIYENYGDGIGLHFYPSGGRLPAASVDTYADSMSISNNEVIDNGGNGVAVYFETDGPDAMPMDGLEIGGDCVIVSEVIFSENVIADNSLVGILFDFSLPIAPQQDAALDELFLMEYALFFEKNMVLNNVGGGIYIDFPLDVGLYNNLVADNGGYGIRLDAYPCDLLHNTVVGNGAGVFLDWPYYVFNNIVAFNHNHGVTASIGSEHDGDGPPIPIEMFYCNDVFGNGCCSEADYVCFPEMTGIDGNISADPLFVGPYDAHLQAESPCINTGWDGVYPFVQDDIEGTHRPLGGAYDMGCYEALVQNWTPQLTQPLASLNLARANTFWSCLKENLPDEMTSEESELVEELQGIMAQAVMLGNPIMTNGLMQQAQELMQQLDVLLQCGCS